MAAASFLTVKARVAREWLLTEFPDDTSGRCNEATKDFMRWTPPQNSFHSPTTGTERPTTEPPVAPGWDASSKKSRLRTCGGTQTAKKPVPLSHHKDTIQLPGCLLPQVSDTYERVGIGDAVGLVPDLEAQAANYARWIANRDGITLPSSVPGAPIWSDMTNGTRQRRISAVSFGDTRIDIPHWDWTPAKARSV